MKISNEEEDALEGRRRSRRNVSYPWCPEVLGLYALVGMKLSRDPFVDVDCLVLKSLERRGRIARTTWKPHHDM